MIPEQNCSMCERGCIGEKDISNFDVDGFRMRVILFPKKRSETCRHLG